MVYILKKRKLRGRKFITFADEVFLFKTNYFQVKIKK